MKIYLCVWGDTQKEVKVVDEVRKRAGLDARRPGRAWNVILRAIKGGGQESNRSKLPFRNSTLASKNFREVEGGPPLSEIRRTRAEPPATSCSDSPGV